jgi:membrane dipeptidase
MKLEQRSERGGILWLTICFALSFAPVGVAQPQISSEARSLHQSAFVFDGHIHAINRQFHHGGNFGERLSGGQFDLPRARAGGMDAFFLVPYILEEYYPARLETKQTLRLLDLALRQIAQNEDVVELALNASDIDRICAQGKIAVVLGLEGGFDLDGDLGVLRNLYRLGLRVLQLPAHNWANEFADSCCAPHKWNGLNEHGRAVVREMNRLGMVICVSHASDETMEQTIEISSDPVVATHHGLRHFNDIPRTMPDHLLKKLAAKGGVIGFHVGNSFHNREYFEWLTGEVGKPFWDTSDVGRPLSELSIGEIDELVAHKTPSFIPEAPENLLMSVDEWVEVVDYAIRLVGEDHVALGSDFDGGPNPARGIRDVRDLALITEAMLRRGYSEQRIRKFLGGNLLRVFRKIADK